MKNKLFILLALVGTAFGQGQYQVNAALSAQDSGACSTANACLILPLPSNQSGSAAIQLQGTFTATVQFEATADPEAQNAASTSWSAISGTPLNSTTTVTSATGTGIWRFSVGGLTAIRARVSSFGSGSVNTTVTAANVSAGLSGGGSGTVTSIATTSPITGGTITTTGTIACATCATTTAGGALTLDQVGSPAAAAAFNSGTNLVSFTGATGANRFSITNAGTAATDIPLVVNIPTGSSADILDLQVNGAMVTNFTSTANFNFSGTTIKPNTVTGINVQANGSGQTANFATTTTTAQVAVGGALTTGGTTGLMLASSGSTTSTLTTGHVIMGGRLKFTPTATSPTCTFTSGGGTSPTCTVATGSSDSNGIIVATTGTGSPGSTGTITLTFTQTFGTNPPVCITQVSDGNTGQWGLLASTQDKTPSTSSDLFTWVNEGPQATPAAVTLTASTAYNINYHCFAK